MLETQVKLWSSLNVPEFQERFLQWRFSCQSPDEWLAEWLFSHLRGSEGYTAAQTDQDSYHTSQGCVIVQLWIQQVRV